MPPHVSDRPSDEPRRFGVWLIGARGSVATTAVLGAAALRAGLAPDTGMVTRAPGFPDEALPGVEELVFGGHETPDGAATSLTKRAERLARDGVVPVGLPEALHGELERTDRRIVVGATSGHGEEHPAAGLARLSRDITDFAAAEKLEDVVVINLASTEAPPPHRAEFDDLDALTSALRSGAHTLPPSARYAHAAFTAGYGHVNFTPSTGAELPALRTLATRNGVPYAGNDGKTGETLLKSVLAPMFASRHLHVRSWAGTNLLGGGDGATLADPANAAGKLASKSRLLSEMLGYDVDAPLHIDHVADLGERKTAWDHVTFTGFLGAPMTLQFTWQGVDSALAAPLVVDLARLMLAARAAGRSGPVGELAYFFKDPVGTGVHDLAAQYETLRAFARGLDTVRG